MLEEGGMLSHGAVVAREFGVPAVINVPHCTQLLREGDRVLVDGSMGLVLRLPACPEEDGAEDEV